MYPIAHELHSGPPEKQVPCIDTQCYKTRDYPSPSELRLMLEQDDWIYRNIKANPFFGLSFTICISQGADRNECGTTAGLTNLGWDMLRGMGGSPNPVRNNPSHKTIGNQGLTPTEDEGKNGGIISPPP